MRKPASQEPAVYMPWVPDVSVDSGGVEPDGPDSGRTLASPRQMGGVDVGVRVADELRVWEGVTDGVTLSVAVLEGDGVPVCVADTEPVREPLRLPVELDEGVPVWLLVLMLLPVALDEGVPIWLLVPLRLPVALDEGVPVLELVDVFVVERVPDVDAVPVLEDVAVALDVGVSVRELVSVTVPVGVEVAL